MSRRQPLLLTVSGANDSIPARERGEAGFSLPVLLPPTPPPATHTHTSTPGFND